MMLASFPLLGQINRDASEGCGFERKQEDWQFAVVGCSHPEPLSKYITGVF
jgi:hypothetical protein